MSNCQGNGTSYFDPVNCGGASGHRLYTVLLMYILQTVNLMTHLEKVVLLLIRNLTNIINGVYENCQFNNTRGGDNCLHRTSLHSSGVGSNGFKYINCQFNGTSVSPNNPGGLFRSLGDRPWASC